MDRPIQEYLKRGGRKAYIAERWGVTRSYVSQVTQKYDALRVEFDPADPRIVYRLYTPEQKVTFGEYNFFERGD